MANQYDEVHARSLAKPEEFWAEAAAQIHWYKTWDKVLDDSRRPFYRWFAGGELNTCYNALDRHVDDGRAEQPALIYDSPVTGTIMSFSFRELRDRVATCAGALAALGVAKRRPRDHLHADDPRGRHCHAGRRAARRDPLGRVRRLRRERARRAHRRCHAEDLHLSVLRHRARAHRRLQATPRSRHRAGQAQARAMSHLSASDAAGGPRAGPRSRLGRGSGAGDAARVRAGRGDRPALHPLHVRHDRPAERCRARQRRTRGRAQLDDARTSTAWIRAKCTGQRRIIGWVVGHSYIVYAPLIHGNTTVLFEGKPVGTPDAGAFWRVISQHSVACLFTAPTAFRAIKREDPNGEFIRKYDRSSFRTLFLAGERLDPDTLRWAEHVLACAGDRSLVADRDRLADLRELHRAGDAPDQARLADQAGAGLGRARARRAVAARPGLETSARWSAACRSRLARSRPCGTPMRGTASRIWRISRDYYKTATRASSTRTVTCSS